MPANYVLLERVEVGEAGASSITFNSIPQTGYTDLKVVCSTRTASAATIDNLVIKPNGATTNQTVIRLQGTGAAATSSTATSFPPANNGATSTASTFSSTEIYIPNYTSSNYKSLSIDSVQEDNTTTAYAQLWAGLWSNITAISSLVMSTSSGSNFVQYSTFSLYGLAAVGTTPAIAPKASGGNVIVTDGTYWYHAFLASGTFTPAVGLSCDVLVVAGGGSGGGGSGAGGGGGAGGFRTATGLSVVSAAAVVVGAGGAGVPQNIRGNSGSDSTFSTLTSTGGGYGALEANAGGNGGSGGGGPYSGQAGGSSSPATSPVQGYAGGSSTQTGSPYYYPSAGGGGAGAVGTGASSPTVPGVGGIGSYTALTDAMSVTTLTGVLSSTHYYYAGGGGGGLRTGTGGAGGIGGGGQGAYATNRGVNGTANTGGGGGAGVDGTAPAPPNQNSGAGGSGLVIIRYAMA